MPRGERAPVFPWFDDTDYVTRQPLALVARALQLVEYHQSSAREYGEDQEQWVLYGIADAVAGLAKHGEFQALGVFLAGLEAMVPAEGRAEWPLTGDDGDQPRRPRPTLVDQQLRDIVENRRRDDEEPQATG